MLTDAAADARDWSSGWLGLVDDSHGVQRCTAPVALVAFVALYLSCK